MSTQQTMFNRQHPGAAAKPREVQPEPQRQQPAGGEATRDAAYASLGDLTPKHRAYLDLLRHVARHNPTTKGGRHLEALTDMEAAEWLGWSRSTINGRRDELMARNDRAVTEEPAVVRAGRRRCHVTGSTCTAWKPTPWLFD